MPPKFETVFAVRYEGWWDHSLLFFASHTLLVIVIPTTNTRDYIQCIYLQSLSLITFLLNYTCYHCFEYISEMTRKFYVLRF
jgi:hypothetical protein